MSQLPVTPGPEQPPHARVAGDLQPGPPETLATATPEPTKTRKTWPWIAVGAVVLVGLTALGTAAILAPGGKPEGTRASVAPVTTTPARPAPTPIPTTPAMVYGKPEPAEFKLSVKVLEKKCFGSAGCNLTYRIDPTYTGTLPLDPSETYRLTYEVRGVEDGPAVNNFTITGDTASMESEEFGSTPSSRTKLTAKVTDISEE